ncbi:MAG: 5,6-dimethylbenzimidazole synthase [Gammaproteobacteria bacterium]|nr:5,6-dimethylbenzimidazole synthase [Gammaproteobacteria bacterium]NVK86857.1 5,6-dimethylbenzimidazole synthase [Gammaproteobacteria bacterium]
MTHKVFSTQEQSLIEQLMLNRRDVRGNNFLTTPISDTVIEQLLYSATLAPSVGFSQPWEFVVIRDVTTKRRIRDNFLTENAAAKEQFSESQQTLYQQLKLDGIMEAPVNIAVFYTPAKQPVLGQTSMLEAGEYSTVCAIQNMWLMARAMNIGLGWVSILDPEHVKSVLNAPATHKLIGYLCIGHVKEFYSQPELETLKWQKRKHLDDLIIREHY